MISLGLLGTRMQINALMESYRELPRHIAKKHLKAAMKRSVKDGIPELRKLTPKGKAYNTRAATKRDERGRFQTGSGKKMRVRGGALRRSVTAKAKFVGRSRDGFAVGVVGYKGGEQSRKAIWLEYGTPTISPRGIIEKFLRSYGRPQSRVLAREMRKALLAAAREVASNKNPPRSYG